MREKSGHNCSLIRALCGLCCRAGWWHTSVPSPARPRSEVGAPLTHCPTARRSLTHGRHIRRSGRQRQRQPSDCSPLSGCLRAEMTFPGRGAPSARRPSPPFRSRRATAAARGLRGSAGLPWRWRALPWWRPGSVSRRGGVGGGRLRGWQQIWRRGAGRQRRVSASRRRLGGGRGKKTPSPGDEGEGPPAGRRNPASLGVRGTELFSLGKGREALRCRRGPEQGWSSLHGEMQRAESPIPGGASSRGEVAVGAGKEEGPRAGSGPRRGQLRLRGSVGQSAPRAGNEAVSWGAEQRLAGGSALTQETFPCFT